MGIFLDIYNISPRVHPHLINKIKIAFLVIYGKVFFWGVKN